MHTLVNPELRSFEAIVIDGETHYRGEVLEMTKTKFNALSGRRSKLGVYFLVEADKETVADWKAAKKAAADRAAANAAAQAEAATVAASPDPSGEDGDN